MLFRKTLIWLREKYLDNKKMYLLLSLAGAVVFGAISYFLDMLVPWESWGMFVRVFLLIPIAGSLFALAYGGVLLYYYVNVSKEGWSPWRDRFSPTWRNRISMIVGALLLILAIGMPQERPGYTLGASILATIGALLFVFMRKTSSELHREKLGIPDARDLALNAHIRVKANENKLKQEKSKADPVSKKEKNDAKIKARVEKAKAKLAEAEAELDKTDEAS